MSNFLSEKEMMPYIFWTKLTIPTIVHVLCIAWKSKYKEDL